ncbi:UNVERIFIED_CONTAM: hypothetical protein Sradi_3169400 [Sesamum radiatum]|uniref:Uncharacterized protein n=1 Tax=Sesamum radiatum TaxID=300843 RepID=A0AAW2RF27_SESRA
MAAMKPTSERRSETFQVENLETSIKSPIDTYNEYCIHWMSIVFSATNIGRLCNFSGLVDKIVLEVWSV